MTLSSREQTHRKVHFAALLIIVLSLPLSKFLLSVGQLTLVVNWLLWGNLIIKFKAFFKSKLPLALASLYGLHLIGLAYTANFDYGFKDLRIKLPLLALPVILSTSPRLPLKKAKWLFYTFCFALFAGIVSSLYAYFGFTERDLSDMRNISLYISHIRFSLLIGLGVLGLVLFAIYEQKLRLAALTLAALFAGFMLLLGSVSGLIGLALGGVGFLTFYIFQSKQWWLKLTLISFLIGLPLIFGSIVWNEWSNSFSPPPLNLNEYPTHSATGEELYNNYNRKEVENGHYVWVNVAWKELENAWTSNSEISIKGKDKKGQPLLSTLIRYMASKGLTKDSIGFRELSQKDITYIENGHTNYRFAQNSGLYHRLYKTLWEIDHYLKGGNPSGNSLTQRFEFWKTGYLIAKENTLIGVGTGDVQDAFTAMYKKTKTILNKSFWLRAHNQYLTFLIAFGFLGFVWFLVVWLYPLFYFPKEVYFLPYLTFFILFSASCLNEDTLETQIGVTFYAFFNSFLLLGYSKYD